MKSVFLSWLGGDVRGTSPYCLGQGWNVKYALMKAYIEGIEAIKEADSSVRILTTEPLVQYSFRYTMQLLNKHSPPLPYTKISFRLLTYYPGASAPSYAENRNISTC